MADHVSSGLVRRAADDFAAIRARMEELRRERAQTSIEEEPGSVKELGPSYVGRRLATPDKGELSHQPVERCGGDGRGLSGIIGR